ncbi:unnamed protein product, partial [Prorocentrum cordatum]
EDILGRRVWYALTPDLDVSPQILSETQLVGFVAMTNDGTPISESGFGKWWRAASAAYGADWGPTALEVCEALEAVRPGCLSLPGALPDFGGLSWYALSADDATQLRQAVRSRDFDGYLIVDKVGIATKGTECLLVKAVDPAAPGPELESDARVLDIKTQPDGSRHRHFTEAARQVTTTEWPEWPILGPRTASWCLDFLARQDQHPRARHANWVHECRLEATDEGVGDHDLAMRMAGLGLSFDQLNLGELASFELLMRKAQMAEWSHRDRLAASQGDDLMEESYLYLRAGETPGSAMVSPALVDHINQEMHREAQILKERRNAKEERLLSRGGGGGGGSGSGGSKAELHKKIQQQAAELKRFQDKGPLTQPPGLAPRELLPLSGFAAARGAGGPAGLSRSVHSRVRRRLHVANWIADAAESLNALYGHGARAELRGHQPGYDIEPEHPAQYQRERCYAQFILDLYTSGLIRVGAKRSATVGVLCVGKSGRQRFRLIFDTRRADVDNAFYRVRLPDKMDEHFSLPSVHLGTLRQLADEAGIDMDLPESRFGSPLLQVPPVRTSSTQPGVCVDNVCIVGGDGDRCVADCGAVVGKREEVGLKCKGVMELGDLQTFTGITFERRSGGAASPYFFQQTYIFAQVAGRRRLRLWSRVELELRQAAALLIFAFSDSKKPDSTLARASDASRGQAGSGGGYGAVGQTWANELVEHTAASAESSRYSVLGAIGARECALGFDPVEGARVGRHRARAGSTSFGGVGRAAIGNFSDWGVFFHGEFQRDGDIAVLEGRAAAMAARHAVRGRRGHGHRRLILVDGLGLALAVGKGRSPSITLNHVLQQLCAASIVIDTTFILRWAPSEWNPRTGPLGPGLSARGAPALTPGTPRILEARRTAQVVTKPYGGTLMRSCGGATAAAARPRSRSPPTPAVLARPGSGTHSMTTPARSVGSRASSAGRAVAARTPTALRLRVPKSSATGSPRPPPARAEALRLARAKARQSARRGVRERARAEGLTVLQSLKVGSASRVYFQEEYLDFVSWARSRGPSTLGAQAIDSSFAQYLDFLFWEGHNHHKGDKAFAALKHYNPGLGLSSAAALERTTAGLRGFRKLARGSTQAPMARELLFAAVGIALHRGWRSFAIALALSWGAMIRLPSELVAMTRATLELNQVSKTLGCDEGVVLSDEMSSALGPELARLSRARTGRQALWDFDATAFNSKFRTVLDQLGHQDCHPHQVRHGGASFRAAVLGEKLADIQAMLRHQSDDSTERYARHVRHFAEVYLDLFSGTGKVGSWLERKSGYAVLRIDVAAHPALDLSRRVCGAIVI